MMKKNMLYPWSDVPNNNGMTIKELSKAFQVNEEEIEKAIKGSTVGRNDKEEDVVYWVDILG